MQVSLQTTVNASADKVWKILGSDFNKVSEWAGIVLDSKAIPDLPAGSGRICNVKGVGETLEKITLFNDQQRKFAFTFESAKNPFFVKKIENTWRVEPKEDDQSTVQVHVEARIMPVFRQLIGGKMNKMFNRSAKSLLGELKYFVENGRPKPE